MDASTDLYTQFFANHPAPASDSVSASGSCVDLGTCAWDRRIFSADLSKSWSPPSAHSTSTKRGAYDDDDDDDRRKRAMTVSDYLACPIPVIPLDDALRQVSDPATRQAFNILNAKIDDQHQEQQTFNYHMLESLTSLHRMAAVTRPLAQHQHQHLAPPPPPPPLPLHHVPRQQLALPLPPPPHQHQEQGQEQEQAAHDNLLACALVFIHTHGRDDAMIADCITPPIELPAHVKPPRLHRAGDTYYVVSLQLLINLMQSVDADKHKLKATVELTLEHLDEAFPLLARSHSVKWVPHTLALRMISIASVKMYMIERASFDKATRHAVAAIGADWAARLCKDKKAGAHGNQLNFNAPGANYDESRAVARLPETRYLTDDTDPDYGREVDDNGWLVCSNKQAIKHNRPKNVRCTKLISASTGKVTFQPADFYKLTTKPCVSGKFAATVQVVLAAAAPR